MYCYFHEKSESIKTCSTCDKRLCDRCYHTEYPDYCWSCGVDHDNSLGNNKGIQLPKALTGKPGRYIQLKLAAAGGTYISIAVLAFFISGLFGFQDASLLALLAAVYASISAYTYGIASSLVIDYMVNLQGKMRFRYLEACLYVGFGAVFPILISLLDGLRSWRIGVFPIFIGSLFDLRIWGIAIGAIGGLLFYFVHFYLTRRQTDALFPISLITFIPFGILLIIVFLTRNP